MPLYCFRIIDHEAGFADEIYQYCEDVAEAVALTETVARELIADDAYYCRCTVIVTDRQGTELARMPSILLTSLQEFWSRRLMTSVPRHRLH
jgi:hypothetical protein